MGIAYDLDALKDRLLGTPARLSMLAYCASLKDEEILATRSFQSCLQVNLQTLINAYLVGLDAEATMLVEQAQRWQRLVRVENKVPADLGERMLLWRDMALIDWLASGKENEAIV